MDYHGMFVRNVNGTMYTYEKPYERLEKKFTKLRCEQMNTVDLIFRKCDIYILNSNRKQALSEANKLAKFLNNTEEYIKLRIISVR